MAPSSYKFIPKLQIFFYMIILVNTIKYTTFKKIPGFLFYLCLSLSIWQVTYIDLNFLNKSFNILSKCYTQCFIPTISNSEKQRMWYKLDNLQNMFLSNPKKGWFRFGVGYFWPKFDTVVLISSAELPSSRKL